MENPVNHLSHKLIVDQRERINLTGATEVIRFDDDIVEVNTCCGTMTILGEELRLKCLSLEDGALVVQGRIHAVSYQDPRPRRGLFR